MHDAEIILLETHLDFWAALYAPRVGNMEQSGVAVKAI
jgi:hypothetical protein